MIHIEIPHKTFNLYKNGVRTFIHLPTEDGERLKLTYGEIIVLVNKETKEELEQVFWFHYKLKSIPRFQFLVFEWDKKTPIFSQRKIHALQAGKEFRLTLNRGPIFVNYFSDNQMHLYHQLQAFSSFFFLSEEYYIEGETIEFNSTPFPSQKSLTSSLEPTKNRWYIITDILKIKKNPNKEESDMFQFYSVFPISLLHN